MSATRSSASAKYRELGLTDHEYELIVDRLGREPNDVELAMLSLMWSEHCAYKHSKRLLRRLPTEGPHVLMGPGENAGAVDVGDGLAVAFKVESHNHPSAVEPFQGAATGVGGILRDVFAIGARPIAVLDSLRFGEPAESERSRYLLSQAVAGIGHYGNSIGVPTIGGEIYFESSYEQNCLVNAMCLGLAPRERLIRAAAAGPGNVVVLLGALTGRDGIGGASVLASAELGEGDEAKRPSVQIGDPFSEKKLLECCLELLDRGLLTSLQDLGAAGLTSAVSEMASKGEVGIDIDLCQIPLREPGMEPFEIMVSESQERMLCVVAPERVGALLDVCEHWEVLATPIGSVTTGDRLRVLKRGAAVADLPVKILVDDCPLYDLEPEPPEQPLYRPPAAVLNGTEPADRILLALLGSANIASRRPVFEQYDPVVQSRTVRRPDEADAAVLALPGGAAIAVSIDGNGRRVACDPRRGAAEAVYECAANLACVGAEPLGLTNCLNFGNPEKPHVAWQLTEAVDGPGRGLRAARRAGRRRQRVALQRGAHRPDLPHAGRRHRRPAPRRRPGRPARVRPGGRRDRARRPVRSGAGRFRAGQAAGPGRCGNVAADRPGGGRAGPPGGPRGRAVGRPAQRPRHRRGRHRGRAGRVLHRGLDRRHRDPPERNRPVRRGARPGFHRLRSGAKRWPR